jgi:hypothetical protein
MPDKYRKINSSQDRIAIVSIKTGLSLYRYKLVLIDFNKR